MPEIDEHGRPKSPRTAGEVETLLGFLDYQRATLAWKCSGLTADGLRAKVGASALTLGGLLKHMALVEDIWFSERLHGNPRADLLGRVAWNEVISSADRDSPEELFQLWEGAVQRSRALVAKALADGGLDYRAYSTSGTREGPSLRWILVHMIEEYARHNGHADLLRESVDGATGE